MNSECFVKAENDPRFVRTEYYVSTQLLNSIYGFSSCSQRLHELAESSRGALVNNARCMGLFDRNHGLSQNPKHTDIQSSWDTWIQAERSLRIAWAIYVGSSSL